MSQKHVDTEFARARADLYDLLSRVFDGDVALLDAAMEAGAFGNFEDVLPDAVATEPLSRSDLDREALEIGYDNLFEVPGPHYVPPFASGHVTDPSEAFESDAKYHEEGTAGELLGDPAESVAELYERANFTPDRGGGIPDHVAAEFEFMAVLATQTARSGTPARDGTEAIRATEERLLEHLEWIDAFADRVAAHDGAEGVYAALCSFASAFVSWDRRQRAARTA